MRSLPKYLGVKDLEGGDLQPLAFMTLTGDS